NDASVAEPAVVELPELRRAREERGEVRVRGVAPPELMHLKVLEDVRMDVEVGVGSRPNARAVPKASQHARDVAVDARIAALAVPNSNECAACPRGCDEPLRFREIRPPPFAPGIRVSRVRAVAVIADEPRGQQLTRWCRLVGAAVET